MSEDFKIKGNKFLHLASVLDKFQDLVSGKIASGAREPRVSETLKKKIREILKTKRSEKSPSWSEFVYKQLKQELRCDYQCHWTLLWSPCVLSLSLLARHTTHTHTLSLSLSECLPVQWDTSPHDTVHIFAQNRFTCLVATTGLSRTTGQTDNWTNMDKGEGKRTDRLMSQWDFRERTQGKKNIARQ